jgi:hypothetical protein
MSPEDSLRRDLPVTLPLSPESSPPTSLVLWGQLSARAVVGALGAVKALPPVALASWHAVRRSVHLLQHEDDDVDDQDDADDDDSEHVPAAPAHLRQHDLGKGAFRPPRPLVPPPSRSTPAPPSSTTPPPPAAEEEKEQALGEGRELQGRYVLVYLLLTLAEGLMTFGRDVALTFGRSEPRNPPTRNPPARKPPARKPPVQSPKARATVPLSLPAARKPKR